MSGKNSRNITGRTQNIVLGALMAAIIFVATCLSFPNGVGGYTHLGDAMIIIAVMFLGKRGGAAAGGIGAALADIILGYAMWAPVSLISKILMAWLIGSILEKGIAGLHPRAVWFVSVILGCVLETAIYTGAGYFLEGGVGGALAEAVGMAVQCGLGVIVGLLLTEALQKSPLAQKMAFRTDQKQAGRFI